MKCFSILAVLLVAGANGECYDGPNKASKQFLNCARIKNPRKCEAVNGACAWRDETEVVSARAFDADEYDEAAEYWPDGYVTQPQAQHRAPDWYMFLVASIAVLP